jgi:uncharacterized protein with HEPN domain
MVNNQKKLLVDILSCVVNIENYLVNFKDFDSYDRDLMVQDAVERNLITIGEAMKKLLGLAPAIPIANARRIVDARNKLTHGYDEIENVQVWSIVVNHLPMLKIDVTNLLNA